MFLSTTFILFAFLGAQSANAACEPQISYPVPHYDTDSLKSVFKTIDLNLEKAVTAGKFDGTSFSLEISSSGKTLHSNYHTDKKLGGSPINGSSRYRIASNTKVFTALGILQQEAKGNLGLDDEVTEHLPKSVQDGKASWEGVTIRSLLAHLGGIPDNYGDEDLSLLLPDPSVLGLPPIDGPEAKKLPKCGAYSDWKTPCTDKGLLGDVRDASSVFPPQKESSYSNVGFSLLGQVLEEVSGMKYEHYVTKFILNPLELHETTFKTPKDSVAAQAGPNSDWGKNQGVNNPGGGMYSSSSDMIKFLRWILNNHDNITSTLNWFQPAAWSSGSHVLLGYPWEIFRATDILPNTKRPVTFFTKGGGLTGYYSYSIIVPQYDLVIFMAVAGDINALNTAFTDILNPLVIAAETETQSQLKKTYAGTYLSTDKKLNSSITFTQTNPRSLYISAWVSNSTDVMATLIPLVANKGGTSGDMYFQLIPAFQTRHGKDGRIGEVWRFINVIDDYKVPVNASTVWTDYCVANVDPLSYGTVPLNEGVFWRESHDPASPVTEVTLSAFKATLRRK